MVSLIAMTTSLLIMLISVSPLTISLIAYSVLNDKVSDLLRLELLLDGGTEFLVVSNDLNRIYGILSNGSLLRVFKEFNIVLARGDLSLVSRLAKESSVITIVPNFIVRVQIAGDVRVINVNSSITSSIFNWGRSRVGSDVVNKLYNLTGLDVIVAVLDTGISLNHNELKNKLLTVNPLDESYPGGWIEFDRRGRPICSTPRDTHFHGTWVSSIIVGNTVGIAPNAKLMHALVLHGGEGTAAQVLAGLEWVLNPYTCTGVRTNVKPDIVSLSFGSSGNYSDIFLTPISKLIEQGIVVVGAIGNDGPGTSSNPGNIWGVIGVGALNRDDNVADFSSSENVEWPSQPGSWPFTGNYPRNYVKPDFVAPGVLIPGAYIIDGYYIIASGTSASTPIVTGVVALLKEVWKKSGVNVTVQEVYDVLNRTADKGCNISRCGWGIINAIKASSYVYGRALSYVSISINASYVKPLETIELTSTIPLTYFINGNEVARGVSVIAKIPLLDMGYHFIHAVSDEHYGYLKFYVNPLVLIANKTVAMGSKLAVLVSGFPAFSDILVYLNENLLTYRPSNTWGSYVLDLIIPYINPGIYSLVVMDSLGLAIHTIELNISTTRIETLEQLKELRVYVLGPQIAYVDERVSIYVISVINNELVDLNKLNYRFIDRSPISIEGPVRLERGVCLISFIPQEPGVYTVIVEGVVNEEGRVLRSISAFSLSVVSRDTEAERRVYLEVTKAYDDIRELINKTAINVSTVFDELKEFNSRVTELYYEVQKLRDTVTMLLIMSYVITFLVITLLVTIIIRKIRQ